MGVKLGIWWKVGEIFPISLGWVGYQTWLQKSLENRFNKRTIAKPAKSADVLELALSCARLRS